MREKPQGPKTVQFASDLEICPETTQRAHLLRASSLLRFYVTCQSFSFKERAKILVVGESHISRVSTFYG
jgi:hypothetical protein